MYIFTYLQDIFYEFILYLYTFIRDYILNRNVSSLYNNLTQLGIRLLRCRTLRKKKNKSECISSNSFNLLPMTYMYPNCQLWEYRSTMVRMHFNCLHTLANLFSSHFHVKRIRLPISKWINSFPCGRERKWAIKAVYFCH